MDKRLRVLGLTVSQYSSLELLSARPGVSNADLARGVFVRRQATHQLLAGLQRQKLIRIDGEGKEQRLHLTPTGASLLKEASTAVAAIEEHMLAALDSNSRNLLRDSLNTCASALSTPENA